MVEGWPPRVRLYWRLSGEALSVDCVAHPGDCWSSEVQMVTLFSRDPLIVEKMNMSTQWYVDLAYKRDINKCSEETKSAWKEGAGSSWGGAIKIASWGKGMCRLIFLCPSSQLPNHPMETSSWLCWLSWWLRLVYNLTRFYSFYAATWLLVGYLISHMSRFLPIWLEALPSSPQGSLCPENPAKLLAV